MSENINTNSMLRVGTLLHGTYKIESYLSSGGFGNTYVATNQAFDETYAVKEFFMKGITERDSNDTTVSVSNIENKVQFDEQLEKFKKEARRLRKLKCENIVRVYDLFEENGTAYYVMDYIDGENLQKRLERKGQPLTESEVLNIFEQVLTALDAVHKSEIYHLDLKPANIMVDKQNCVKLIDFGASKQQSKRGGATTNTSASYTKGYAPLEQMEQNFKKIGPWTDFYALGATLYKLLSNNPLPTSTEIHEDDTVDKHLSLPFPDGISLKMRRIVIWMMSQRISDRPQSVEDICVFLKSDNARLDSEQGDVIEALKDNNIMESDVTVIAKPEDLDSIPPVPNSYESSDDSYYYDSPPKSNLKKIIGIVFFFAVVCVLLFFLIFHTNKNVELLSPETEYVKNKSISLVLGGCSYTGDINKDGVPNGNGTAVFSDGRYYEGPFVNGALEGDNAVMKQSNGDKFEGSFSDNHYLKGKYTDAKGNYYVGTFRPKGKNSEFLKGTLYNANGEVIQHINN